jgi:hypothetical protein
MASDLGAVAELGGAAAVEFAASALAERGARTATCHNCGVPVIGAYCAVCGQERDGHRRSLLDLLHDLVSEIASFDSRILRTTLALLVEPGELPLAFNQGRTRRYVPAIRLYLFVSLLFFLTLSMTGIALVQIELQEVPNAYAVKRLPDGNVVVVSHGKTSSSIPAAVVREDTEGSLSPGIHAGLTTGIHFFGRVGQFHQRITPEGWARIAQLKTSVLRAVGNDRNGWVARNALATIEKLARDPAALNGPLTTWIPRVFFLLLPLFGVLLALFYIRQRRQYYFVDHLVFSLSIHSFVFAILILAIGAAQMLPGGAVAKIILLSLGVYLFIALKRFYGQGWVITTAKFAALSFVYTIFVLLPALVFVLATGFIEG